MKRILLLALMLGVSACADQKNNPTAPSSLVPDGPSPAIFAPTSGNAESGDKVPFHILHPVLFPMSQALVTFPPRNEPNVFFQNLQALYRDTLRRTQTGTFVDSEGQNVWLTEYFRFYLNGCSHEDATSRTLQEIRSGATQPVCGAENLTFPPRNLPNDFQNRLQAAYRDDLRRPETLSYVDSEGANVWLAQYLRFRVVGNCDHASAESRVFTEIRGGGVQPVCGPPFSRSGIGNTVFDLPSGITRIRIIGNYTGSSSNFIVRIGGRLIVNELVGTYWQQTRHEGTYVISGTVVEITNSSGVSWSFAEVR